MGKEEQDSLKREECIIIESPINILGVKFVVFNGEVKSLSRCKSLTFRAEPGCTPSLILEFLPPTKLGEKT